MLTGDNRDDRRGGRRRGSGIDDVRADVLPADKREVDPAAAAARAASWRWPATASTTRRRWREAAVGIAMGTGTDVAIESAGITLRQGRPARHRPRAPAVSRATMRNIRQNLFLAFVYNAVGVPVAAGVLYPFTGMLISPIWASAAMTLSSVSVIGNALRLRRVAALNGGWYGDRSGVQDDRSTRTKRRARANTTARRITSARGLQDEVRREPVGLRQGRLGGNAETAKTAENIL